MGAGPALSSENKDKVRLVLGRLYDIFDTDGNGVVDFTELSTGLTVLCGGQRDEGADHRKQRVRGSAMLLRPEDPLSHLR